MYTCMHAIEYKKLNALSSQNCGGPKADPCGTLYVSEYLISIENLVDPVCGPSKPKRNDWI